MSLSNLPTGTVRSPEPQQGDASAGSPRERGVKGTDVPAGPSAGQRGSERHRVEKLEAELEAVRAERDRLREERNEVVTRYEYVLRQERERSKRRRRSHERPDRGDCPKESRMRDGEHADPPAGDTVRLKVARLFGLR